MGRSENEARILYTLEKNRQSKGAHFEKIAVMNEFFLHMLVRHSMASTLQVCFFMPFIQQHQQMGFKPRLELPNPTGPGVQTVQFPVPSGKCGLVIGKGMW